VAESFHPESDGVIPHHPSPVPEGLHHNTSRIPPPASAFCQNTNCNNLSFFKRKTLLLLPPERRPISGNATSDEKALDREGANDFRRIGTPASVPGEMNSLDGIKVSDSGPITFCKTGKSIPFWQPPPKGALAQKEEHPRHNHPAAAAPALLRGIHMREKILTPEENLVLITPPCRVLAELKIARPKDRESAGKIFARRWRS
jgi:hypothetical protein